MYYVSTHTYVVSENTPFSTKYLLFLLMSTFFAKNNFTQSNSVRAVLEIFQFCFQFLLDKRLLLMKMYVLQTMRPESSIQIAPNRP